MLLIMSLLLMLQQQCLHALNCRLRCFELHRARAHLQLSTPRQLRIFVALLLRRRTRRQLLLTCAVQLQSQSCGFDFARGQQRRQPIEGGAMTMKENTFLRR